MGKSTIAISPSRELAEMGKRVLLVDMDLSGFSSLLAGITDEGLISSTVDGRDSEYVREVETGGSEFTVVKFCGDGPRLKRDLDVIRDNEFLRNEIIGGLFIHSFQGLRFHLCGQQAPIYTTG